MPKTILNCVRKPDFFHRYFGSTGAPLQSLPKHKSNEWKFQWLIDDFGNPNSQHVGPPNVWLYIEKKSQIKVIVCARHIVNAPYTTFCQNGDFGLSNGQIPLKPTWHLLNINLTESIKEMGGLWLFNGINGR